MTTLGTHCRPVGPCIPGKRKLFVNCEGNFYVCEKMDDGVCIGNVQYGINDETVLRLIREYEKMADEECKDCWAVRFCEACYLWAKVGDSLSGLERNKHCAAFKESIAWHLVRYCELRERKSDAFDFLDCQPKAIS